MEMARRASLRVPASSLHCLQAQATKCLVPACFFAEWQRHLHLSLRLFVDRYAISKALSSSELEAAASFSCNYPGSLQITYPSHTDTDLHRHRPPTITFTVTNHLPTWRRLAH